MFLFLSELAADMATSQTAWRIPRLLHVAAFVIILLCPAFLMAVAASQPADAAESATLTIQGRVIDATGAPVPDASIIPYLDGKPSLPKRQTPGGQEFSTGQKGLFVVEFTKDVKTIVDGEWSVKITRSGFAPTDPLRLNIHDQGVENGERRFVAQLAATLERTKGPAFWIALGVFILVYVTIMFELLHRTLAAFLGASALLLITHSIGTFHEDFRIITYEQAMRAVDWNVVFLLIGMMLIVGVLKKSGIFQWMAYKSFQLSKGRIFVLSSALCIISAVTSAFLDNVTTMLLLTPITIEIALALRVSPFVFLLPEILASNIGGTATSVGDPPNILIGSYAGLSFNDFVINLGPVVLVTLIAQLVYNKYHYQATFEKSKVQDVDSMVGYLKEKYPITDHSILRWGGAVLLGVIVLFTMHGFFHMEVSVAAIFGAGLAILVTRTDMAELLENDIEWPSLVFFIMLFIVVGAAEHTGILQSVADAILKVSSGNITATILIVLWVSAIASAVVDNIPYTAAMLPIVVFLNRTTPGAESGVIWWALALGACFGGNGTIIGASANVVTVGIAEKAGYKITFGRFFREAAPITIFSLIISSIYLLLAF